MSVSQHLLAFLSQIQMQEQVDLALACRSTRINSTSIKSIVFWDRIRGFSGITLHFSQAFPLNPQALNVQA